MAGSALELQLLKGIQEQLCMLNSAMVGSPMEIETGALTQLCYDNAGVIEPVFVNAIKPETGGTTTFEYFIINGGILELVTNPNIVPCPEAVTEDIEVKVTDACFEFGTDKFSMCYIFNAGEVNDILVTGGDPSSVMTPFYVNKTTGTITNTLPIGATPCQEGCAPKGSVGTLSSWGALL